MNEVLLMLQLFTTLPIRKEISYDEEKFHKTAVLMPLLGLILGLMEMCIALLLLPVFRFETVLILLFLLNTLLTGGIHLDGLADTCDGVFSGREREKVLEIMKDSRVGTFGILGIILYLLLKGALLLEVETVPALHLILVLPSIGRSMLVFGAYGSAYARKSGFGKIYIGKISHIEMAMVFILSIFSTWRILGEVGAASFIGVLLLTIPVKGWLEKLLGGITGDILGAILEVTQLVFLLIYLVMGRLL